MSSDVGDLPDMTIKPYHHSWLLWVRGEATFDYILYGWLWGGHFVINESLKHNLSRNLLFLILFFEMQTIGKPMILKVTKGQIAGQDNMACKKTGISSQHAPLCSNTQIRTVLLLIPSNCQYSATSKGGHMLINHKPMILKLTKERIARWDSMACKKTGDKFSTRPFVFQYMNMHHCPFDPIQPSILQRRSSFSSFIMLINQCYILELEAFLILFFETWTIGKLAFSQLPKEWIVGWNRVPCRRTGINKWWSA